MHFAEHHGTTKVYLQLIQLRKTPKAARWKCHDEVGSELPDCKEIFYNSDEFFGLHTHIY